VQLDPASNKIDKNLCNIQKISQKVYASKQKVICISSGMLFWHTLVGSFRIAVPIATSQKTQFWHPEKWNTHFSWVKIENCLCDVATRAKAHDRV
jgi:hypothetical protein